MPGDRHDDGSQRTVERARRPRRDAGGLDGAVERAVKLAEALVVGPVARLVEVQDGDDEAAAVVIAADAAGRLDVFGGGLGLALDQHEPEPRDVEADGDHVGGERHVDRLAARRQNSASSRCLASATLSVETRDVSSSGSLSLRSLKGRVGGLTRRRSEP